MNTSLTSLQTSLTGSLGGGVGAGAGAGAGAQAGAEADAGAGLLASGELSAALSAALSAGAGGSAGAGATAAAQGLMVSGNGKNTNTCPNNITNTQRTNNISKTLMSVDQSTLIMNQSSLSSISSVVNQTVVNSMKTTMSSSSQNVNITQTIIIAVNNTGGDVNITGVRNKADVNCSNTISMNLSAIDDVRTDLSNELLNQFASSANTDALDQCNAAIQKDMEAANDVSNKLALDNRIAQNQAAQIPTAIPTQVIPPVPGANINNDQTTTNDATASTIITAPYTQSTNISRSIQSSILNSVTQNFTHETVTQLITAININQNATFYKYVTHTCKCLWHFLEWRIHTTLFAFSSLPHSSYSYGLFTSRLL
jgi:hypothetical protein